MTSSVATPNTANPSLTGAIGVNITATTGELDLTATAGAVDINGGTAVNVDSGTAAVTITGGVGTSIAATTGNATLNSVAGIATVTAGQNVNVTAAGLLNCSAGTIATIEGGTGLTLAATAGGAEITGGVRVNPTAVIPDGAGVVAVSDTRSGSFYVADLGGGDVTYNLPAMALCVGRKWTFISAGGGDAMIINAGGAYIYGAVHEDDIDAEGAPSTTGTFGAPAAGDYLEVSGVHDTMLFARGQTSTNTFAWS